MILLANATIKSLHAIALDDSQTNGIILHFPSIFATEVTTDERILGGFGWSGLNGRLVADRHDPLTISFDPQTAYVDRLAGVRLMLARHYDGVPEIKHLRGNERSGRGTEARLLLQIESSDAVGFGKGMVVARAEHHEFIGDVGCPSRGIMISDAGLEGLPGSDDGLLGFISGLVGQGLAGIFAILDARTAWAGSLAAENDFVIDEQTPACGAPYPNAEDMSLITSRHHGADLAAKLLLHFGAGFVAESGRGKRVENFCFGASLTVGVRPGEIRVQDFADCCRITFCGGLYEFVVGLQDIDSTVCCAAWPSRIKGENPK
jgi:hypothetical protein